MEFIDLKVQYRKLRSLIDGRIQTVLEHGKYIMGPEVAELESRLANYVGAKHCISVSSGTDALLIAMMAIGVRAGDEIITTPFSFVATAEMIVLLGASPVFVDIDPRTYNLDPTHIAAAITDKTKAIIAVDLYGQCADFDAINAVAARHGIVVIEDAAQSFGATYKGRRACALSAIGCTSFFPSKPLGCYGDGGACFTDDDSLARAMREVRNHGQDKRYHHRVVGVNGRLDTLQAAVLLAKLEVFEEEVRSRSRLGERYTNGIRSYFDRPTGLRSEVVSTPEIEPWNTSVYAQYTVAVERRNSVADHLNDAGIPTAIHYPRPLHLQPAFASLGYFTGDFPHAELAAEMVLSLPMHPYLDAADQDRIVGHLLTAVGAARATVN